MRLDAVAALRGVLRARVHDPGCDLRNVHCDSRRVDAATGFLALPGLRTDGHRFLDAARNAGAPALFVSDAAVYERLAAAPADGLAGVFQVAPGRAVLAELSAALCGHPSRALRLLGVTGTSGKTTVVHLVGQLLAARHRPCALLGTQGLRLGDAVHASDRTTPEAPDIQDFLRTCVERGVDMAAMEVTSIGIAQERTHGLSFAAAAFTNLSQDHLDFHGTMEAYREEKFRLFGEYAPGAAVVNLDDPAGDLLAERLRMAGHGAALLTTGLDAPAALTLEELRAEGEATTGRLRFGHATAPFSYALPGRFNLANLLTALGLLLAVGEPLAELAPAVATCTGAGGRFERVPVEAPFTVIVDYSHKPQALELVLAAARPLARGRLHVLFGCGGDRDRAKRPQMGAIAEHLADHVVLSSDNPRSEDPEAILADIAAGMQGTTPARRIADRREAIHWLLGQAGPGDVVVVAGKGDEAYQEVGDTKRPFDDRQVVRDWAREHGPAATA